MKLPSTATSSNSNSSLNRNKKNRQRSTTPVSTTTTSKTPKCSYLFCGTLFFLLINIVNFYQENSILSPLLQSASSSVAVVYDSLSTTRNNNTTTNLRTSTQQQQQQLQQELVVLAEQELEEAKQVIADLQQQLVRVNKDEEEEKGDDGEKVLSSTSTSSSSSVFQPHEICSYLHNHHSYSKWESQAPAPPLSTSTTIATSSRLWQQYLPHILQASKNPDIEYNNAHNNIINEKKNANADTVMDEQAMMQTLLDTILPPSRLRRSIRHLPTHERSHQILKNVLSIVEKRIHDPIKNPPLRIVVLGGSVTLGRGCPNPKRMTDYACAWPHRLELFMNQLVGLNVIKVYNLAVGGTGSGTGTNLLKYWMYPDRDLKLVGPDVIINSYSTNDSLPPWDKKTEKGDDLVTLVAERVRKSLQDFVRTALHSKSSSCQMPPLVVHVDDYVGAQQTQLLGELSYLNSMTQIAKYYDTVGISYGEVVRDLIYQDNTDRTFAGADDVHYGHFAHQTIAWSVGFTSLELVIQYCDDEHQARTTTTQRSAVTTTPASSSTNTTTSSSSSSFVLFEEDLLFSKDPTAMKKTIRNKKLFLPPPLTRDLLLKNATNEFTAAIDAAYHSFVQDNCTTAANTATASNSDSLVVDHSPCMIAWIASPGGYTHKNIQQFMNQYASSNTGWQNERSNTEGWSLKDGWIATKANAQFTLTFPTVAKDVKTITFYYIRSYGDKWKDSRAKFVISRLLTDGAITNGKNATMAADNELASEEIAGVFADADYHYSSTLSQTLPLSEVVRKGGTIQIQVELVGGTTFKIMGLTLCNK